MKYFSAFSFLAILCLTFSCSDDDVQEPVGPTEYEGYTLIWNDEFNGGTINSSNWTYETGDGTDYDLPVGWGNSEKQIYTTNSENSSIQEDEEGTSSLVITALEDSEVNYTSAKLTTQGLVSVRFGRIEARIKSPEGKGLWPAFWMLGDNITEIDWPGCGEIDILEVFGADPNTSAHTVHYTNAENSWTEDTERYTISTGSFSSSYHLFTLDWTPGSMIFKVDNQVIKEVPIADDMKEFLRSMYLILNVAVGGNPGNPDETTVFPQAMYVDYIRVYEQNNLNPPASPTLDIDEESLGSLEDDSVARLAISEGYDAFGPIIINIWGAGGEPDITPVEDAVNGEQSLQLSYPGGNWGGAFFEMEEDKDFNSYANGNLIFSLKKPAAMFDGEIKLESPGQATAASIFLIDYIAEEIGDGWFRYNIPMADFEGLDLSRMKIPFSLWNPKDTNDEFFIGDVLIDDIHISQ